MLFARLAMELEANQNLLQNFVKIVKAKELKLLSNKFNLDLYLNNRAYVKIAKERERW